MEIESGKCHYKYKLVDVKEVTEMDDTRRKYDKDLIRWVKRHYWDSLEKDKALILRHLRTFTGDAEGTDQLHCHRTDKPSFLGGKGEE